MTRQNKLTITVKAFFSDKYFFILSGLLDGSKIANLFDNFFLMAFASANRLKVSPKFLLRLIKAVFTSIGKMLFLIKKRVNHR